MDKIMLFLKSKGFRWMMIFTYYRSKIKSLIETLQDIVDIIKIWFMSDNLWDFKIECSLKKEKQEEDNSKRELQESLSRLCGAIFIMNMDLLTYLQPEGVEGYSEKETFKEFDMQKKIALTSIQTLKNGGVYIKDSTEQKIANFSIEFQDFTEADDFTKTLINEVCAIEVK